ncbi:MAG: DUF6034 family protein [Clostridiales bacterium]|nr:DUF6034 family protein [Clostridiales bacterium]
MKQFVAILMVLACLFGLVGCRSRSDTPLTVGQGDVALERVIAEQVNFAPTAYTAPAQWTDSIETEKLFVTVNADITVPSAELFPIPVMAHREITQEMADTIIAVLLQGEPLYERPLWDGPYTKQEIGAEIARLQAEIDDPESDFNTKYDHNSTKYADALAQLQQDIIAWQEALETAPNAGEKKLANTQFHPIRKPSDLALTVPGDDAREEQRREVEEANRALLENPPPPPIMIEGDTLLYDGGYAQLDITPDYGVSFNHYRILAGYPQSLRFISWEELPLVDAGITEQQARELALQTVRDMGLSYFDIAECSVLYLVERGNGIDDPPTALRPCYSLSLSRSVGGTTENLVNPKDGVGNRSLPFYIRPEHESIHMEIAKEGLLSFHWRAPMQELERSAENVQLLPFEDIQAIFKSQMPMSCALLPYTIDGYIGQTPTKYPLLYRRIVITEIRLGYMRVLRQGTEGEYLMIPIWDFCGYDTAKLADPNDFENLWITLDENGEFNMNDPFLMWGNSQSYLTINAIDGSIIDRHSGF